MMAKMILQISLKFRVSSNFLAVDLGATWEARAKRTWLAKQEDSS